MVRITAYLNPGVADTNSYKIEVAKSHSKEKKDMKEYRAEVVMAVNFEAPDGLDVDECDKTISFFGEDRRTNDNWA
jgi:hypothetical protein